MNGNKYILAFADIPDDLIRSASDDAAVRKVFRQHKSRRNQMLGVLCCCIVVAVAAVGFGSQNRFGKTPALIPGEPTNTDHQIPGQTQNQPADSQPGVIPSETVSASESTETPASNTENPTEQQPTDDPERREQRTEAPSADAPETERPATEAHENTDDPCNTFTISDVGYAEAKERFGHPIVPCAYDSFSGYRVGIVSRYGNVNEEGAFCYSLQYIFTNGTVSLADQDRMTGSSASTLGEEYQYRNRTFYVSMPGGYISDSIYIGYYPSWDRGIAYVAVFAPDADIYEIMDLIISLEI